MSLLAFLLACSASDDATGGPIPPGDRPPRHDAADTGDTGADDPGDPDDTADVDSGGQGGDTGDTDTGGGDTDTDDPGNDERAEACHPDVAGWPRAWADLEEEVLDLVNAERARGADCGQYGRFGPADPLVMDPEARCAARYHSLWMAENGQFAHESPGGDLGASFDARMRSAGYRGSPYGENIAAGYTSARDVMAGWMASDGHCANVMAPYPTDLGVGYYQGGPYGAYWTQDFGY